MFTRRGFTPAQAKDAALSKQLAQLERDGQKLEDSIRFLQELRPERPERPAGEADSSDQDQTSILHHEAQLSSIRAKLVLAVTEIDRLQEPEVPFAATPVKATPGRLNSINGEGGGTQQAIARGTGPVSFALPGGEALDALEATPVPEAPSNNLGNSIIGTKQQLAAAGLSVGLQRSIAIEAQQGDLREAEELHAQDLNELEAERAHLESSVRAARIMAAARDVLRAELTALQPKAEMAQRMRAQVAVMQESVAEAEALQGKLAALSIDADRLPHLRTQLTRAQAGAAEARALQAQLAETAAQQHVVEQLKSKLKLREEEARQKAATLADVKARVEGVVNAAREVDQLEAKFSALAPMASRLPVVRGQIDMLQASCAEVDHLEAQVVVLKQLSQQRRGPQNESVRALQAQLEVLRSQQATAERTHNPLATSIERTNSSEVNVTDHKAVPNQLPLSLTFPRNMRSTAGTSGGGMPAGGVSGGGATQTGSPRHSISGMRPGNWVSGTGRELVRLMVTVREEVVQNISHPVFMPIQVVDPLPGVPPELVARLAQASTRATQLTQCVQELQMLEEHCERQQRLIDSLRASPAALQVLQLQHQLLALQQQEVEALEHQVAGLSGVGERVMELRKRRATLEADEEEAIILEAELEVMAEERRLREEAQQELDAEAEQAQQQVQRLASEAGMARQQLRLKDQVSELQKGEIEVERLTADILALEHIPGTLAELMERHEELSTQVTGLRELDERVAELERLAEHAQELRAALAVLEPQAAGVEDLQARHAQLLRAVAQAGLLKGDCEVLQLQAAVTRDLALPLAAEPPVSDEAGEVSALVHHSKANGATHAQMDFDDIADGRTVDGGTANGGGLGATLEDVFSRLRMAEAQRQALTAENSALAGQVEALHERNASLEYAANQQSSALEKLRGLVAAVGRIRTSGSVPSYAPK